MRDSMTNALLFTAGILLIGALLTGHQIARADVVATDASEPAAAITTSDQRISLIPFMSLFEDKTANLSFDQIREHARFQPLGDHSPNFGFTGSAWWVKFKVHNPGTQIQHLIIRQDYPLIDFFDVWYTQGDDAWEHIATGDRRAFHQRPIDNRTFLIPLTLEPGETVQVYARAASQGSMNIGLFLHSDKDLISWVGGEYLAFGVYYGGFLVLIVYNLIVFLNVREKAFVYYLLYALSYGLYFAVHNGISFQYLWPDNTWLANKSLLILLALSLYWVLRFTRTILSTAELTPRSDRVAGVLERLSLAFLILSPFLPYHTVIVPIAFVTMVICGHMMSMAVQTMLKGSMPARYYLIAFTALLAGVFAYMLKTFGLIPHNVWTQNAFQVGSLIEMVLLSIAVASRVNEIKLQTLIDALTQLYNRRYMDDQLSYEIKQAGKKHQPLTLAIIDIDHFKKFNDTHGHATGDEALQTVANILRDVVRKPSTPCRYGGEEFVLILPNTRAAEAEILAERIRQRVETSTQGSLKLTVSIGYACTEQGGVSSEQDLFKAADFALYQAKGNGRNQVVGFDPEQDRRMQLA